jgi:uncharacterized protein YjdB
MKKNTIYTIILGAILCFISFISVSAQHSTFFSNDDSRERGYYTRPYLRYEAEPEKCTTDGIFLPQTFDQSQIQNEASNQQAIKLISVGQYVQWTCDEESDGMTIRFSIPDNAAGTGTKGTLELWVDGVFVQDIVLDSYWAWQYVAKYGGKYPYNESNVNRFARMPFDEVRVKLDRKILAGETFKLIKKDAGAGDYTIDFVELELIPEKVTLQNVAEKFGVEESAIAEFDGDGSNLANFVSENKEKIIYIPEGKYDVPVRLYVYGNSTKLIGAGMWYTQLHFTASPNSTISDTNSPSGYNARGLESSASDLEVSGFYITTVNERRYANYSNSNYQVGKGLNGSFGTNSKISDIWVEHFECGAWIENSRGLHISNSRFRNNYADGINLCYGTKNAVVEQCSFRNNGDDDMASWSRAGQTTINNTFQYCISENCWRAAGIGFFGGKQNKALNCVIIDPVECGIRANNDFDGAPFSEQGFFEVRDISIYRAGGKPGTVGISGDLWGERTASIFINSASYRYDVRNIIFSDIDIYDSKGDALFIQSGSKKITNVMFENVVVDKVSLSDVGNIGTYYGLLFDNAQGSNNNLCINFKNVVNQMNQTPPAGFIVTSNCNSSTHFLRVNETLDLAKLLPESFSVKPEFIVNGDQGIVFLDEDGIITALQEGTTQIKAIDPENNFTFIINVKDVAVTGVSLSDETIAICVGDAAYPLYATIEPDNATDKTLFWLSSNTSVALVSTTGRVTAKKQGTATIMVTTIDGSYMASCYVTVDCEKQSSVIEQEQESISIISFGNTIQISGQEDGEKISVYNLLGSKVYAEQLSKEETKNIQGLAQGIYTVAAEKAGLTQKVIIAK